MPTSPALPALTDLRRMQLADVDAVLAVEVTAYSFPWTRGNFADSLTAGYFAELQRDPDGKPQAYYVAMPGVEEMHLLNITTAPAYQSQGFGRAMLRRLYVQSRAQGAQALWLEVRRSNERAQRLYLAEGFTQQGLRRAYYPAAAGQREDALVLMRPLGQDAPP
jgi:[ribosomal protein S18]-alanine N-acetyltransferase